METENGKNSETAFEVLIDRLSNNQDKHITQITKYYFHTLYPTYLQH